MDTRRSVFDTYYFRLTRILVSSIGQWPFQSKRHKYFFQVLLMTVMHSIVPAMVAALVVVWGKDITEMVKSIPPLLIITVCDVKMVTSCLNNEKIKDVLLQIKNDWETMKGEEREHLFEYLKKGRVIAGAYAIYMCVSVVIFTNIPWLAYLLDAVYRPNETRTKSLIFPIYYGTDPDENWIWYMFHSQIVSTIAIAIIAACDSMYFILIFCNCGIFAVVRYYLEKIADQMESTRKENSRNIFFDRIKKCIIEHHKAIRCATIIHSIYVWSFLSIVAINMIIISITGVQTLNSLDNLHEFIPSGVFTCGQLFHLLLLSFPGQVLINESESIREAAYKSNWYDIPPKAQKMLILLLMRSKEPCEVTAGKMFVIKMETFTTILQTSASYFTMIASFQ